MSTFSGFFDEIQNVSVDRFTKANFQSRAFLLSHCHTDHMIGLNEITSDNELPGPLRNFTSDCKSTLSSEKKFSYLKS